MKDRGRVKIYGNILSFTMGPWKTYIVKHTYIFECKKG
jgi:hypothetical protein